MTVLANRAGGPPARSAQAARRRTPALAPHLMRRAAMPRSSRLAPAVREMLQEIADPDLEKRTEPVDGFEIHPRCGLVVQQGDGVAMQAGFAGDVRDLQLVLAHQSRQVALDHVVLHDKTHDKLKKRLVTRRLTMQNVIQNGRPRREEASRLRAIVCLTSRGSKSVSDCLCPRFEPFVGLQELAHAGERGGPVRRGALALAMAFTPDPVLHEDPKRFEWPPEAVTSPVEAAARNALRNKGSSQCGQGIERRLTNYLLASLFFSMWPGVPPASMRGAAAANGPGAAAARIACLQRAPFMPWYSAARAIHGALRMGSRRTPPRLARARVASRRALVRARTTRAPQAARDALPGVVLPASKGGKGLHAVARMPGSTAVTRGMRGRAQAEDMT